MKRVQEPERMTAQEELFYAAADYTEAHETFADRVVRAACSCESVRLVDLGTGPGDIPLRIVRKRPAWRIIGVDASANMLEFARKDSRNIGPGQAIGWLQADIKQTALPASSFDVIISNSVLHHLHDPIRLWREVRRLAAVEATVIFRDLTRPAHEKLAQALVVRHVGKESDVVKAHYLSSLHSAYTPDEVREQLAEAGLPELVVTLESDRYLEVFGRIQRPACKNNKKKGNSCE